MSTTIVSAKRWFLIVIECSSNHLVPLSVSSTTKKSRDQQLSTYFEKLLRCSGDRLEGALERERLLAGVRKRASRGLNLQDLESGRRERPSNRGAVRRGKQYYKACDGASIHDVCLVAKDFSRYVCRCKTEM